VRQQPLSRVLVAAYLLFAAALTVIVGLSGDGDWRRGLALAGLPWTALAALALDGVGLVQLPFVLAWETVFAAIGAAGVALNAWICAWLGRRVAEARK